jgi:hypothetical protein
LFGVGLPLAAGAAGANRIHGLKVSRQGEAAVVEIAGERAPNFTTFKQDAPRRVIVDVAECALGEVPADIQGDGALIDRVTTAQYGEQPHGISRVIIALSREAEYKVSTRGGSLFVVISPGAGGLLVSAGVPVAPERPARRERPTSAEELRLPMDVTPPEEADAEALAGPAEPLPPPVEEKPAPEPVKVAAASPPPVEEKPAPEPAKVAAASPPPVEERPAPVKVAMAEPAPAPAPRPAASPPALAQYEDEIEEVEEVPELPEEDDTSIRRPSQTPEEEIPPPPPPREERPVEAESVEEVPPPPPPRRGRGYSEVEERVEISGALKDMTWVGFQQTREASRVFVKTNAPVKYRVVEEGDNLVVLELENAKIPTRNNRRFLDTHFFDTAVTLITPREIEGVSRNVRIEIQLRNRVPYSAGQEDNMVYINFQRAN